MMRICFLNHNLKPNSGAGRFGLNLVEMMLRVRPDTKAAVLTSVAAGHPLERTLLSPGALRTIFMFPKIRTIFKKYDIIHALDGWPYGVIAAIVSLGLGKKLIITAIGTGAIQAFRHPVKGALLRWAYQRADRVIAISGYTKREILSHVPGLVIEVIHHAVDVEDFARQSDAELTSEEQATVKRLKPYILSVGAWKRRKGFEYSFPAFAEISRNFPNLRYVVVGAPEKPVLADECGIRDKVIALKNIRWPMLKAFYKNAELFLLLPFNDRDDVEGFGFAFLEAAAAGIPVIGTLDSGAESAVKHGKNGFLVPTKDPSAAASAMRRILGDAELKRRFSFGSLEFAKTMTWENVVSRYIALYESVSIRGH